eukprot:Opistho-2@49136
MDKAHRSGLLSLALTLFIIACVGIPLWRWTTQTYRAPLPYDQVEQLLQLPPSIVSARIHIAVHGGALSNQRDVELAVAFCTGFPSPHGLTDAHGHRWLPAVTCSAVVTDDSEEVFDTSLSFRELDNILSTEHDSRPFHLRIVVVPDAGAGRVSKGDVAAVHMGRRRLWIAYAAEVDDAVMVHLGELAATHLAADVLLDETDRRKVVVPTPSSVKPHPKYRVCFSLLNGNPHDHTVRWDIRGAIDDVMGPFVGAMQGVAEFEFESQIVQYAHVGTKARRDVSSDSFYLPASSLSVFLNSTAWNLESATSLDPTLHFFVYVPPADESPLHIRTGEGDDAPVDAFLFSQYGGVVVHNPTSATSGTRDTRGPRTPAVVDVDAVGAMRVFLAQLRVIVGIEPVDHPTAVSSVSVSHARPRKGLCEWELDALLVRRHTLTYARAVQSIVSLCRLVGKVENMVVSDAIAQQVFDAVDLLELSRGALLTGDVERAHNASVRAMVAADGAFFRSVHS